MATFGSINPDFDWGGFLGNALTDLSSGLVSQNNVGKALGAATEQGAELAPARAAAAMQKVKDAKLKEQEDQTRKMLASDPQALQFYDAGQTNAALTTFMKNKGMADPIKASPGDVFLDPRTMQPISSVPSAPPKPPEGYDYSPDGGMAMIPGGPAAQKAMQDKFNNEQILNQQYSATDPLKTYQTVNSGYQKVRQSSGLKTGAGDVSMIFAYMKMLDPSSVVREGEFATAQQTAGLPATVVNLYNQAINGVRLNDQQRKDFLSAADEIYKSTSGNLAKQNKLYTSRAAEQGVDPNMFLVDPQAYDPLDQAPAPADYKQRYGLE